MRLIACVFEAGAPDVVAEIVTAVVPSGVLDVVVNVRLTVAGNVETEADGEKLQLTPAGIPVAGHDSVTVPANDPKPFTANVTGEEVAPCCTVTEDDVILLGDEVIVSVFV